MLLVMRDNIVVSREVSAYDVENVFCRIHVQWKRISNFLKVSSHLVSRTKVTRLAFSEKQQFVKEIEGGA